MIAIICGNTIWYAPAVIDGIEITRQIIRGTRKATEVTAAAVERARSSQKHLNWYITLLDDNASAAAARLDEQVAGSPGSSQPGPLAGVPLVLKDNICLAGSPTTAGSRLLESFVPPFTATLVERLVQAGAVPLAKASLDEFAMGGSNEYSAFGSVRNPWNSSLTPGGSSGGSAAAVAAGVAPLALGTDTGGSVRQPAAFCGIIGFKPTFGLLSRQGVIPLASSLDHVGVMARTTRDAALALQVLAGADEQDSVSVAAAGAAAELGVEPFALPQETGLAGLHVAVLRDAGGEPVAPDVLEALNETIALLQGAGATVSEVALQHGRLAPPAYLLICAAEASSNLARMDAMTFGQRIGADALGQEEVMALSRGELLGPEVKRRLLLGSLVLSDTNREALYESSLRARALVSAELQQLLAQADVILAPTASTPAFPLGTDRPYRSGGATVLASLAGLPAVSVPGARNSAGLPLGMQFMANHYRDGLLLRVTAALEEIRGAEFSPVAPGLN